jgi:hypothetical protein
VIAPGIALVGDDGGDVGIRQLLAPGLHGRIALAAIKHDADMRSLVAIDHRRAIQRREITGNALAAGLVTGQAVLAIHRFAPLAQRRQRPYPGRIIRRGRRLFQPRIAPARIVLRAARIHHDGHEAVVLAAQLGTLPAINAGLVHHEPGIAQKAGNGILLHAQLRHPPGMDDIVGRQQQPPCARWAVPAAHPLPADNVPAGRWRPWRHAGGQVADKAEIVVQIVVTPFPLIAGDADGHVLAMRAFLVEHGAGGRPGDGQQDQQGNHRPDDFHRGVFVKGLAR